MSVEAKAKIKLTDGREVWRYVQVYYREVGTGRWISPEEAESMIAHPAVPVCDDQLDVDRLRWQLLKVQSQIALNEEGGAKATSAARLVLSALREMQSAAQREEVEQPWFTLGRALAKEVLALVGSEREVRQGKQGG